MSKRRRSAWYGVKTLDRVSAAGKPRFTDTYYDADTTLVEERIVLFRADSAEDAIRAAEKEARTYAKGIRYTNVYGQKVRARYLGACYAYEAFDPPRSGAEVFSTTAVVPNTTTDATIAVRTMGKNLSEAERRHRGKFIDGEIWLRAIARLRKARQNH